MFPGLAVGKALRDRGHAVAVILSGRGVEADRAGSDLPDGAEAMLVPVEPLSPRRPLSFAKMLRAILTARRKLRAFRPDALLAMGSYTSIAPVLAARSLGIPVVLHEANAIPGSAVAHLARFASAVGVCFPGMERAFPKGTTLVETGLPLRAEFTRGIAGSAPSDGHFRLLVMGGSQGARDLNVAIVQALAALQDIREAAEISETSRSAPGGEDGSATGSGDKAGPRKPVPPFRVVHLTGRRNEEDVRALYADAGLDPARVEVEVVGFEHDMARRYAEADLCISRAGASSCFELALVGLPAIFVPLPGLARDHQLWNAEEMAVRGAGDVVEQSELNPEFFAGLLAGMAVSPAFRAGMREALLESARPDAASSVADLLERVAADRGGASTRR